MKPKIFIASSVEGLDYAYALQENIEYFSEVTVWTQGVFAPSRYTLESLTDLLDDIDFGVFLFTADDALKIRDTEHNAVRDNIVFEFGLFVGRLGREKNFIVMPRGNEDIRLPTDLVGITPITFEASRVDKNIQAALGPASNKIKKTVEKYTPLLTNPNSDKDTVESTEQYDNQDIISILESWMGSNTISQNKRVMKYSDIDRDSGLPKGSAKNHIEEAAKKWGLIPVRKGSATITFTEKDPLPF